MTDINELYKERRSIFDNMNEEVDVFKLEMNEKIKEIQAPFKSKLKILDSQINRVKNEKQGEAARNVKKFKSIAMR